MSALNERGLGQI